MGLRPVYIFLLLRVYTLVVRIWRLKSIPALKGGNLIINNDIEISPHFHSLRDVNCCSNLHLAVNFTQFCKYSSVMYRFEVDKWKWNGSGFRPLSCTYRLNWSRRASWGWWAEWDDTALQTQDSYSNHGGLRSSTLPPGHRAPHNTEFYEWMEKNFFFLSKCRDRQTNPEI